MGTDIELESANKSDCLNPAHPPRDDHRIFVPELHAAKGAPVPGSPGMLELQDTTLGIDPAPDGGWKAYSVCFGAFLCNFCIFGFSELSRQFGSSLITGTAFGQLKVYYLDHQLADSTESEVGYVTKARRSWKSLIAGGSRRYHSSSSTSTQCSRGDTSMRTAPKLSCSAGLLCR